LSSEVKELLFQFVRSLNYRLKGVKCPYCGREIEVEGLKLECCKKVVGGKE
jgi:hypothetical protein